MAENYGSLEGVLDANETLEGEIDSHDEMSGEIQFAGGVGGVKDVQVNNDSVVDANKVAHIDLTPYAEKEDVYDKDAVDTLLEGKADTDDIPTDLSDLQDDSNHRLVTDEEKTEWSGKADTNDIPTALSQLDNDDNYVQDADYVHTDNNFTDEDKTAIGNIPENVTDLSDVAVNNIQNGQVLKWDATQEKFVNADESGGGSGDVTDVKVNNASVVDAQGVANIDLTGYAEKSDLGTASSKDVPATGNAGANEVVLGNDTRLSDSRPASDVSSWAKADSKPTYQYSEIQNTPSLGTAAAKDFDNSVIDGSSNLVTGDAVHDAIDNAVSGAYKHAGTKTCAELISSLLVKANAGNVYNMTDSGTTTSDFIEGAGLPIRAGDNVGVAKINENTYKFDLLSGFVDTSNFITKSSTSGLVKNDGSIDTTSYQPTESGKGLSTNDYDNIAKGKVDALGTASTKNVPTSGDAGNNEVVLGNDTRLTDARPASDVSAWAKESTKPSYTKSEVGLDNVDNTSDSTKKTNFTGSIASGNTGFVTGGDAYTALNNKADKVSGATNGNLAGLNGSGNLTDSGWNGAKDTTSISGNPISISGLKSNQLAKDPIITLEPIQAGSGTPSLSNIRAISGYDKIEVLSVSINIFPEDKLANVIYNNGVKESQANAIGTNEYIVVKANTAYYFSISASSRDSNCRVFWYDKNYNVISYDTPNIGSKVYTSPATAHFATIFWKQSDSPAVYRNDFIFCEDSLTDKSYVPYVKTTDLSESLGQTVYGGSLDVRTGIFTKIWGYIASYAGETLPSEWISDRDEYVSGTTPTTGAEVAYKLASANYTTIQLTPHEISLLKDYAYVSTNGTSISLDYHNGELASLADVSQLGETVNEGLDYLKDYVEKNNMGTSVDLSSYYDTYHQYIFPTDGYILVSSESATSGVIRVAVRSGDNKNIAAIYMNVTGNYQIQSLFVRKGMSAFVQNNTATNSFTRFNPLV